MSADFNIAYNPVRTFEGDWCDVPGDKGGETYAGIARAFFPDWPGWHFIDAAKAHPSFQQGSLAFSRHLTTLPNLEDLVTAFYRVQWWDKMGLARWPQLVANELFEQAVNLGRGGSGKLLQRVCNAMNYVRRNGKEQRLFDDLDEDGAVGPKTVKALALVLEYRAERDVVHALNAAQGKKYLEHRREQLLAAQIPRGLDDPRRLGGHHGFFGITGYPIRRLRAGAGRPVRRMRVYLRVPARAHGTVRRALPPRVRPAQLDRLQQGQGQERRRRGQWRQVMSGPRLSASFNCSLKVFGTTAARLALALCALALLTSGCNAVAGRTSALPPAPATPGALVTDGWAYREAGQWKTVTGEWVHLPAQEAGELQLWIEQAESI